MERRCEMGGEEGKRVRERDQGIGGTRERKSGENRDILVLQDFMYLRTSRDARQREKVERRMLTGKDRSPLRQFSLAAYNSPSCDYSLLASRCLN